MANSITKKDPRDIALPGFTLTSVGAVVVGKPSFEEWQAAMQFAKRVESGVMFWIGDLLVHGYANYGEIASQEDGDGKYSKQTLYKAKSVAERVDICIRMQNLAWEHHQIVAPLPPRQQTRWLQKADKDGWSVAELRKQMRAARAEEAIEANPLPANKFNLIYADPPWQYDFAATENRKIENHYPTMEVDAICELEVNKLAHDDCVLFLWATSPKLPEAIRVVEAWGFEYKTCMVWNKDKIGMGYYARQKHELLLIATCGQPPVPAENARPDSVIDAPRGEHSAKPDVFYDLIEQMYPSAKRIELFARGSRDGWHVWGNECGRVA